MVLLLADITLAESVVLLRTRAVLFYAARLCERSPNALTKTPDLLQDEAILIVQ